MKHIVFLLGSFYPNYSAVGYCGYRLIKELKNDSKITIISVNQNIKLPLCEIFEGCDLKRIVTKENKIRFDLKFLSSNKALNLINKALLFLYRILQVVIKIGSAVTVKRELSESYLSALNSLKTPVDVIIPLISPIESLVAAVRYKSKCSKVKVIPIFFDKFAGSESLHVNKIIKYLKFKSNLEIEKTLISKSDTVLSMPSLENYFDGYYTKKEREKIVYVEHPLLIKPKRMEIKNAPLLSLDAGINCIYAGSFIKNIRTPNYLLSLISNIESSSLITFNFYTIGKYNKLIKANEKQGGINLIAHGSVAKSKADQYVSENDILINVGEFAGSQISSKLFEYMALGKPIVHLAYKENDIDSRILAKYPMALVLLQDESSLNRNAKCIVDFIEKHKRAAIDFKIVRQLYPEALPETTANIIQNLIDNG